jgi:hypothetical protein
MKKLFFRLPALAAAIILLQTLFFKFSGAAESVYIFSALGLEPWGRIGSGAVELVAAILLLIPRTAWMGAVVALGVMGGAITSHLTVLGLVVMDDGGTLFFLALAVALCSSMVLLLHRHEVLRFIKRFRSSAHASNRTR